MWGTHRLETYLRSLFRFIPTHVGNTVVWFGSPEAPTVHPHACGEHLYVSGSTGPIGGSSPRMWGTPMTCLDMGLSRRFIPTHVGNTARHSWIPLSRSVHPHACGEHLLELDNAPDIIGSSPRMWGTRPSTIPAFLPRRFIPTHVGNTTKIRLRNGAITVHPHACGEHAASASARRHDSVHPHACGEHGTPNPAITGNRGSSPRMWGTQPNITIHNKRCRFIPTHVGNTSIPYMLFGPSAVHPHACGEHLRKTQPCGLMPGSSPRMWGTLSLHRVRKVGKRFIPTHVGNTASLNAVTSNSAVHPHACGEHFLVVFVHRHDIGSSPRMWGTLLSW